MTVLTASDSGLVFGFDQGTGAVLGWDIATGEERWRTGRAGVGPNEYQNPTSLVVDFVRGQLLVHDPAAGRISRLSFRGRFLESVMVARSLHRLAQVGGRWVTREETVEASFLCWQDAKWNRQEQLGTAVDSGQAGMVLGEPILASDGKSLAVVYRCKPAFVIVTPPRGLLRAQTVGEFKEPSLQTDRTVIGGRPAVGMRVQRGTQSAASGAALSSGQLVILHRRGSRQDDLLDYYDGSSGAYRFSRTVPVAIGAFTVRGDTLVAFESDRSGSLQAFVWDERGRQR